MKKLAGTALDLRLKRAFWSLYGSGNSVAEPSFLKRDVSPIGHYFEARFPEFVPDLCLSKVVSIQCIPYLDTFSAKNSLGDGSDCRYYLELLTI